MTNPLVNRPYVDRVTPINADWLNGVNDELQALNSTKAASSLGAGLIGWSQSGAGAVLRTVESKMRDQISVNDYGAKGDGLTDDTAAIATAIATGFDVFFPRGVYKTTAALQPASNQVLFGVGHNSQILCVGVATNAISISGKTRAVVCDLFVKYTGTSSGGGDGAAIWIGGASSFSTVRGCRLEGVRAGVTITAADDNVIENNDITLTTLTYPENTWDIGVYLGGSRNRIVNNRCFGGGYVGIQLLSSTTTSVDRNIVSSNHVSGHTGYGIVVYAATPGTAEKNVVLGNQVWDITGLYEGAGSRSKGSGIYIASAEWTTVVGNVIENTNVNTDVEVLSPGAIGWNNVSCGVCTGNIIKVPKWYGVCAATDGNGLGTLLIEGNVITSPVKAAIRIKEMINVSILGNSGNGGTSDSGISVSHSGISTGIKVMHNHMRGFAADAAIRITNCQTPNISFNYCGSSLRGLFADLLSGGIVVGNEFRNNTTDDAYFGPSSSGLIHFDRNTVRGGGTNGINDTVGVFYGQNDVAGQTNPFAGGYGVERTLPNAASSSVLGARMAQVGGATPITDLTNPTPGQEITLRANGATTIKHNTGAATTKMMLNGGADFVMAANSTLTLVYPPGGPWFEKSRKA